MYSIQKYVLQVMKEKGLKKSLVVQVMGFTNISKGCNRFDRFINDNEYNEIIVNNLALGIDVAEEIISQQWRLTDQEIEIDIEAQKEIERQNFVPFLYCRTVNRRPSSIFTCGIIRADRMKFVYLPENFNELHPEEQDMFCRKYIKENLAQYEGVVPTFGAITHFVLKKDYDNDYKDHEVYDLNGNRVFEATDEDKKLYEGRACVKIKNNDLGKFLRNRFDIE